MREVGRFATRLWTPADDEILRSLVLKGVDARVITAWRTLLEEGASTMLVAAKLKRIVSAIGGRVNKCPSDG